jgi:hypothetical protein
MALWKVEPTFRKCVVEETYWKKDGKCVINRLGWRWCTLTIETEGDDAPEVDEDTDYMHDDNFKLVDFEMDDAWSDENDLIGIWEDQDREDMEERINDGFQACELEEEGWRETGTDLYIQGDVEITKIEE